MTQEISTLIQQTQFKLVEKLKPSGWYDLLRFFVTSDDFTQILTELYKQSEDGKKFTPTLKYLFRAFEECPVDTLKVVVIGQDPYPIIGVADGISFSCSLTGKPQPSLRNIFEAIDRTVHQEFPVYNDPDLKRWSNQGILMLNTALTCQIGKIGSHINLWKPFTTFLFDAINYAKSDIIFIMLGKKAEEYTDLINDKQHVLITSHPASAVYSKDKKWNCDNIFIKTNDLLTQLGKTPIRW